MSSAKLELYTTKMTEICDAIAEHDLEKVLRYFDAECVVINGVSGSVGDTTQALRSTR